MAKRPESFAALLRVHLAEESWMEFAWNELASCWRAAPLPAGIRETKRNSARGTKRNRRPWLPHAAGSHRERGL
jgi:hypothetical protein